MKNKNEKMTTVQQVGFRDIDHQVCLLGSNGYIWKVFSDLSYEDDEKPDGVVVYEYIDHEAGVTFEFLAWASVKDGNIELFGDDDSISLKFRRENVADCMILPGDKFDVSKYQGKIDMINKGYSETEGISVTRNIEQIDNCRSEDFPDDVLVYLLKGDMDTEGCWVRCNDVQDNQIIGELLNEPDKDFGVHCGDPIKFGTMKEDNEIICVAQL